MVSSKELIGYESSLSLSPGLSQMFDKIKQQKTSELRQVLCRARAEKGLVQGDTEHLCTVEIQYSIKSTSIRQAWVQIPVLPLSS